MNILKLTTYAKEYTLQFVILVSVITTGYVINENAKTHQKILSLEGGIGTCFQRVNQTFTAKIISDLNSTYLSQNFQALTEECMAEALVSAEEVLKKSDTSAYKKLSTLASSIHWFHEDILASDSSALTGKSKSTMNPSERFEKIESLKDDIFESTDALKAKQNEANNVLKMAFVALMGLFSVAILIELFRQTKRRFGNFTREKEAQSELFDYASINHVRSVDILRNSLENNELYYCSKLLGRLIDGVQAEKNTKDQTRTAAMPLVNQMVSPTDSAQETKKKMDLIWENSKLTRTADGVNSNEVNSLVEKTLSLSEKKAEVLIDTSAVASHKDVVNLESSVEKIFDLVSDRIFKSGIAIELNMDSSLNVVFKNEELDQVLFQIFNNAIRSLETKSDKTNRKLTINGIKLGTSVVLDVINSGMLQTQSVIDQEAHEIDEANIGLTICEAFMEEFGGKVQFDTIINNQGQRTGEIVKLVFKGTESNIKANSARLVDVKVGTKKEILNQITL